ncbi:hypothetical protein GDO78_022184 [Eleutherodactylus coqui]|uniref:Uncharacterized protein n=1 Tax=Eleutherodactylus coqui TaxID=57060 RepID=A0A8J6B453_ELECQ|nr:hypothetical protein GDO78_022184 [Eleutherodactylus coqui]
MFSRVRLGICEGQSNHRTSIYSNQCKTAGCVTRLVVSMADHSQSITTLSAAYYCLQCQRHLCGHGSCHYNQRTKIMSCNTSPDHIGTSTDLTVGTTRSGRRHSAGSSTPKYVRLM